MNYIAQSKKLKPTAKNCLWCKNFCSENHGHCKSTDFNIWKVSHRLVLKMDREEEFRYCQHYRFSKKDFATWKHEYLENQKFYDKDLGKEG